MIGSRTEAMLAIACEQRLGEVVHAASAIHVRRVSCPTGRSEPRKPEQIVMALTDTDVWFLELRHWIVGFTARAALCRLPRQRLVAHSRHRWWAWPNVWKLELSWPELATYVECTLMSGADADRIMGLIASDEFQRELRISAPSPG